MAKTYYPVNLDVFGKKCVVVGGGAVAERKAKTLLKFGAKIVLISPQKTAGLSRLVNAGKIKIILNLAS